ncbi:hypothetical protein HDU82_000470 [Entophlyctis luteolus]|nr:hypothetical protein HDU82_000470 [Entophlyctis luteolus]
MTPSPDVVSQVQKPVTSRKASSAQDAASSADVGGPSAGSAGENDDYVDVEKASTVGELGAASAGAHTLARRTFDLRSSMYGLGTSVLTALNQLDFSSGTSTPPPAQSMQRRSRKSTAALFARIEAENQAVARELDESGLKFKPENIPPANTSLDDSQTAGTNIAVDAEVMALQMTVASKTKQVKALTKQVVALKESNEAKDAELARVTRELQALQQSTAKLEQELLKRPDDLDDSVGIASQRSMRDAAFDEEKEKLTRELKQMRMVRQVQIAEFVKEKARIKKLEEDRLAQLAEFSDERDALLKQMQESSKSASTQIEELTTSLGSLKAEKGAIFQTVDMIEAERAELKRKLEQLTASNEQTLEKFTDSLKTYEKQLKTLQLQNDSTTARNNDLERQMSELSGELTNSESQLQAAKTQMFEDASKIKHLTETMKKLKSNIQSQRKDTDAMESELAEVTSEHTAVLEENLTGTTADNSDTAESPDLDPNFAELVVVKLSLRETLHKLVVLQEEHEELMKQLQRATIHVQVLEENVRQITDLLAEEEYKVDLLSEELASRSFNANPFGISLKGIWFGQ